MSDPVIALTPTQEATKQELAEEYIVGWSTVDDLVRGKTWKHVEAA
jgi:hypothetical protein